MYKILPFLLGVFLITSCTEQKNKTIAFASDNPAERVVWERIRLMDPTTGEILSEDSAWRHPKIIADIQEVLNENEN